MRVQPLTAALALASLALGACGGDDDLPPLTDATVLACPYPGALPFRTEAHAFTTEATARIVDESERSKDEASDTLGVPGGPLASIYLADDQAPEVMPIDYRGLKARTTQEGGLSSNAVPHEPVSLWQYDPIAASWQLLGRTETGDDGAYDLPATGFVATPGQPVYAMLEGDGSCAVHLDYVLPAATKLVVTDIDGTLTTDDAELFRQVADGTYLPAMMTAGNTAMQAWAAKGYQIVYLTARPHLFRAETRAWLDALDFPPGPVITTNGVSDAAAYKTIRLDRMIGDFGWEVVAAYGNAGTDIAAYANAGIAKDVTFIVGDNAGMEGTQPIAGMDFTAHVAGFIEEQPLVIPGP